MKLFAILDIKANHYLKPFTDESTASALRGFETAVNDSQSALSQFPDDFALMELGEFDRQNGIFMQLDHNINLGTGRTVKRSATIIQQ